MCLAQSANNWTAHMLIHQSYKVGTVDYESLGFAIGGPIWKVTLRLRCCCLLPGQPALRVCRPRAEA